MFALERSLNTADAVLTTLISLLLGFLLTSPRPQALSDVCFPIRSSNKSGATAISKKSQQIRFGRATLLATMLVKDI